MNESSANKGFYYIIAIAIGYAFASQYPEEIKTLLVIGPIVMFFLLLANEVKSSKRKREAERRQKEEEMREKEEWDAYHRARCQRLRALKNAKDNFDWPKPDSLKKWRELSTG